MQLSELIELVVEAIEERYPHIPERGKRALLEVLLCRVSDRTVKGLFMNYGILEKEKKKKREGREIPHCKGFPSKHKRTKKDCDIDLLADSPYLEDSDGDY
jgi:hypothetical protein